MRNSGKSGKKPIEEMEVVQPHKAKLERVSQDTSERKQLEEVLWETHNYLEKLINYANAPIIVWDPKFRITRFNRAFEHLTGYTTDEVIGEELNMLFPKASRKESRSKIERTLRGEYWESVEIPILCKNGETRLALWNSANIYAEDGTTLLAIIAQGQDITERKQAEEKLLEYQEQLKSLASELTLAEERERRRIATELHSTIGQSLVSSKIELDALRHSVSPRDPGQALKEVSESLGKAIDNMRSLTFDLSFPILYELGFETAVAAWLADQI